MNPSHEDTSPPRRQALSAVHLLNLQFLVAVRDALRTDPAQASYEYGIDVATADVLRHASDEGLRTLSYSLDRALFTLRLGGNELHDLMQRPPVLRGLLVTVRETKAGSPSGNR